MREDPNLKLTRWLTEGLRKLEDITDFDRTRLMTSEQKAWYQAALALDDDYFTRRVQLDMKLMMAFKGRRSDDVVESMQRTKKDTAIHGGVQPVGEYLRARAVDEKRVSAEE